MDYHTLVVNSILSFRAPFTYEDLINKIKETVEFTDENRKVIINKVKEILDLTTVRQVPLTKKYYVIGTASEPKLEPKN